jgi:hypothetical protein
VPAFLAEGTHEPGRGSPPLVELFGRGALEGGFLTLHAQDGACLSAAAAPGWVQPACEHASNITVSARGGAVVVVLPLSLLVASPAFIQMLLDEQPVEALNYSATPRVTVLRACGSVAAVLVTQRNSTRADCVALLGSAAAGGAESGALADEALAALDGSTLAACAARPREEHAPLRQ